MMTFHHTIYSLWFTVPIHINIISIYHVFILHPLHRKTPCHPLPLSGPQGSCPKGQPLGSPDSGPARPKSYQPPNRLEFTCEVGQSISRFTWQTLAGEKTMIESHPWYYISASIPWNPSPYCCSNPKTDQQWSTGFQFLSAQFAAVPWVSWPCGTCPWLETWGTSNRWSRTGSYGCMNYQAKILANDIKKYMYL